VHREAVCRVWAFRVDHLHVLRNPVRPCPVSAAIRPTRQRRQRTSLPPSVLVSIFFKFEKIKVRGLSSRGSGIVEQPALPRPEASQHAAPDLASARARRRAASVMVRVVAVFVVARCAAIRACVRPAPARGAQRPERARRGVRALLSAWLTGAERLRGAVLPPRRRPQSRATTSDGVGRAQAEGRAGARRNTAQLRASRGRGRGQAPAGPLPSASPTLMAGVLRRVPQ